jgi:citrate lyase synthetase
MAETIQFHQIPIELVANSHFSTLIKNSNYRLFLEKVYFRPSNFCLNLVLTIKLQNRISLTIELLKPFTIGHQAVLMGGFNFFYLQFSP